MKFPRSLVFVAVLILLGAGCSSTKTITTVTLDGQTTTTTAVFESKVTVNIDEDGFHPSVIYLNKGGTVTFKNTGKVDVWPASNPHPSHMDYPKFDPKHSVKAGETYTIDFPDVKTYGFHDHRNPANRGQVVVQ